MEAMCAAASFPFHCGHRGILVFLRLIQRVGILCCKVGIPTFSNPVLYLQVGLEKVGI
jgi:hypothetical protein